MVTAKDFDKNYMHIFHKFYYKEDEHWVEETTTFPCLKDKLPDEICKMLDKSKPGEEVDITDFIDSKLDKFKGGETVND